MEATKKRTRDRSKHKQHKEYWIAQGYSEEEAIKLASEYNRENNCLCIEYYEKRYPELTDEERWAMREEVRKKRSAKMPDISGENNPAHHSKTTLAERKSRSPYCIEFYIKKYPGRTIEEYEQMVKDAKEYSKERLTPDKCNSRIEYYLAKGMTEEEAREALSRRQSTFTLESCIKKYGPEKGLERFNARQEKWQKSLKARFEEQGYNGVPQSMFANGIIDILSKTFKNIQREYIIGRYSFDMEYRKHVIEFNGDYWHMNPNMYKEDEVNSTNKRMAKDIWKSDANKMRLAQRRGFKTMVVWESEYRADPEGVIAECKKFLKS